MPIKIVEHVSRKGMQPPRIVHLRITWPDDYGTNEAYEVNAANPAPAALFLLEYRDAGSLNADWKQIDVYSGYDAAQHAVEKFVGREVKVNSWQDVTESQDES